MSRSERAGADSELTSALLTDTHVHLNLKAYRKDRSEVIARAQNAGVAFMVNVGFDLATSRASIELAEEHEFMRASVGLHPHSASDLDDDLFAHLSELASSPTVVAVGETGLDYYRDLSPRNDQKWAFRRQIQLARELKLPLISTTGTHSTTCSPSSKMRARARSAG